ncbi:MAG: pyridoxal phosphate-dependent aminotransferase [Candidatus Delongbacteria bacterium]|nr:pyridoxal phosphate-dependent aminotransferase [Candidatus Delongbacteria bacterium]MCG2760344.1 pyridoxal phosphate-dependent aminotransferase [Candidatus Delongbacteria bacterium]
MKKLAKRTTKVTRSKTLSVTAKANELKAKGEDIVVLTVGEPDFPTPDNIKKSGIKAINDNFTKYTAEGGIVELKQAVVKKYKDDFGVEISTKNVICSNGAKHALANVILSVCEKGDEVIIPQPAWVSYPELVRLADAKTVDINTDEKTAFKVTPEMLKKAITEKTKLIILCSPSNPTGAIYTEKELRDIGKLVKKHDLYIIYDEIYEKLIFDNRKHFCMLNIKDIMDNVISINGVSKTYAMTGWRIGYAVANEEIIDASHKIQSHMTSNPNSIAQKAALEAILGDQSEIDRMRKIFQQRRDEGYKLIKKIPHAICYKPDGAFYFFVDFSYYFGKKFNGKVIKTNDDLCNFFITELKVAAITGSAFGSDKHIRFSFATSQERFNLGINRIIKGLELLK